MKARGRLLTSASAVGALLALTACEKPAPLVTVVSGGTSVNAEANTFCFEGQTPPKCAKRHDGSTRLAVRGGERVGVDVAKELAERGWYIELSDPNAQGEQAQPQRSEPQSGHYFTFSAPNLPSGSSLRLTVHMLGDRSESTGRWLFTLTPKR